MTGIEIERKFLVNDIPYNLDELECSTIKQGYLSITEEKEIRIRKRDSLFWLTIKDRGTKIRKETEISLREEQFNDLWHETAGKRICKKRFMIELDNHQVELDVFEEKLRGLIVAEIEFATEVESEKFMPLPWMGKEVTDLPGYKNAALAVLGLPG